MAFILPPSPIPQTSLHNFTIGALLHIRRNGLGYVNPSLPAGTRYVLGLPLPTFQRGFVWTEEQKIRFVQSIWHDFPIGTYMVNDAGGPDPYSHPLHDLVIDGQQRLSALQSYFDDEISVFGAVWSEVPAVDQRRFGNKEFARQVLYTTDETALRQAYNHLNFGGTPHQASERAELPSASV